MQERSLTTREAEDAWESVDSDDELRSYLDEIAPFIGWIIIYFNSLEDMIADCLREAFLRDPIQDERLDVFLSDMLFAGKCKALMHSYGQMISSCSIKYTHDDLNELEKLLLECAKRRNEYAHADWIGMKQEAYVRVKSQSKKLGILHRYKKFEPAQMEADIQYIYAARDALEVFNERIHDQLQGREE
jgi:hypothetical protein